MRNCALGRDDVVRDRVRTTHDLKKLFAASFDARFLAAACCSRSISEFIRAMRSINSSTDSSDRSWPISWVIFFRGLSSSSLAMRFLHSAPGVRRWPAAAGLANQGPPRIPYLSQGQIMEKLPAQMTVVGIS